MQNVAQLYSSSSRVIDCRAKVAKGPGVAPKGETAYLALMFLFTRHRLGRVAFGRTAQHMSFSIDSVWQQNARTSIRLYSCAVRAVFRHCSQLGASIEERHSSLEKS